MGPTYDFPIDFVASGALSPFSYLFSKDKSLGTPGLQRHQTIAKYTLCDTRLLPKARVHRKQLFD